MDEIAVLVLNYTFEPLHFTNARRAITLLLSGKAEPVEASPRVVRSPSVVLALPAVIRLAVYIRKPFLDRVAFNKKNILRRDSYTCQYCSRRGERLTVDHIVPRSRGGETSLDQRGGGLPALQSPEGQPPARRGRACGFSASRCIRSSCSPPTCSATPTRTRCSIPGGSTWSPSPADGRPSGRPSDVRAGVGVSAARRPAAGHRGPHGAVRAGRRHMVLRGVTGSGKTYTIANVIANVQRPTLVISPNKTLAAQLFGEFRAFFPRNAVEYFVSYYDYYQPEAYIPQSDTYIEKDALINDEIDRMRHSATTSLLERRDVVVVASVSCIYGIGAPDTYQGMHLALGEGDRIDRDEIIRRLVAMQYERNDYDFHRGTFRVRGDVVEVFPANEESMRPAHRAVRRRRRRASTASTR